MNTYYKYIALVAVMIIGLCRENGALAQADSVKFNQRESSIFSFDQQLVHNLGMWVRSPFLDSWYAQWQGGGFMYSGTQDYLGPLFGKNFVTDGRITYNTELKIGRWVYPKLGYRVGLGLGYAHGFLSKRIYNDHLDDIRSHSGLAQSGPGLIGYYWNYNDSLMIQRWSYSSITAELMVKLINVRDYNPDRPFNVEAFVGVGLYNGLSEYISAQQKHQFHMLYEIHAGAIAKYRINSRWSTYVEMRATLMDELFDREHVLKQPLLNEDLMYHMHVGLEYNFNFRKDVQRTKWDDVDSTIIRNDKKKQVQSVYNAHQINIQVANYVDTLFSFDTVSDFSPNFDEFLNRRARQHIQAQIDSIRMAFDRDCQDATLDDILSRRLLPYEMVFFDLDKWDILPAEDLKIRKMASVMKAFPDNEFLLIGSADSKTGSPKRNEFLSVSRSDVVYNQLIYQYNVSSEQLKRVYLGGILDYAPYELNRATVIIMDHPKVVEEFEKLRSKKEAGGHDVEFK